MTPADCYYHAAQAKFDDDDFTGTLELARVGLLKDEDHPGLLQMYGLAAYHLGALEDALEGLEGASIIAPLCPLAQLALADVYLHFGQRKSAAAGLSFLAEPGRCPTPLLPDLARLLGKLGAYRSAYKVCRRLAKLRSWYHPAHYGMAYYLAKLKKTPRKIIVHLRAAHELAPNAIPYRVALAGALSTAGFPEEACEVIRCVPPGAVSCPDCLNRIQLAAEEAGEVELAMRFRDRLREVLTRRCDAADGTCFEM
jgi:tetratricopeptide (TPR) repeat protein